MINFNDKRNSMLFWYPKIKELPIPQPKTIIVKVNPKDAFDFLEDGKPYSQLPLFEEATKKLGYPIFIRTDQMSGKHDWKNTCYVESEGTLIKNLRGIVEATLCCDIMGRDVNAIVFREYIEMDSKYTAFYGEMPVNPERRYFVENCMVLCHHPYWFEEAIRNPNTHFWKELSREMNKESQEEVKLLSRYANVVSRHFLYDGFWSIDFCKARDGKWYLIDMATGENSWHPEDCPNNRTKKIDLLRMEEVEDIEKINK